MKPRITLAETQLPDGGTLALQEHDGRKSLLIHGQQICGPATRAAEEELARLACAPFRPARQPVFYFLTGFLMINFGLILGSCPIRIVLLSAYGSLMGLVGWALVVVGVGLGIWAMRKMAGNSG